MIPITGKAHDLGDGFTVTRLLPGPARRTIGPFIFLDYFGPVKFAPGKGLDVRPHPHIGLATITYLFDGTLFHRDTLGSSQEITPGDVNWMTAGRGIAHSERTGPRMRAAGHRMHGIQSWVGLPLRDEETEPVFQHISAADLPVRDQDNVRVRMIAGTGFGLRAPVKTFSPIFYADAQFAAGGTLDFAADHEERAFLVIDGQVQAGGAAYGPGSLLMLEADEHITLGADAPARVMLLGGAALDGPRHLWWNFVSSDPARIEKAKDDWRAGRFGLVPGDDKEFIPLPADRQTDKQKQDKQKNDKQDTP